MSAADNLSRMFDKHGMLPLFVTPREIAEHYSHETEKAGYPSLTSTDYNHGFDSDLDRTKARVQKLFDRKVEESSPEFVDSILKHGVQVPIHIDVEPEYKAGESPEAGEPTGRIGQLNIGNGNHRFAVALKHRPDDLIPVSYDRRTQYSNALNGEKAGLPRSYDPNA